MACACLAEQLDGECPMACACVAEQPDGLCMSGRATGWPVPVWPSIPMACACMAEQHDGLWLPAEQHLFLSQRGYVQVRVQHMGLISRKPITYTITTSEIE